ncbi:MAG: hypothetical protein LBP53_07870 [Candidatus Peribacteria bacterium]|jgi:hypothetical protein|nr:hypothetical protein [Candidatus Peribacteria bacterium]
MHAPQTEDADTEQKVDIEQKAEPDFSNFDPFEEENTQNDQQEKQEAETPGTSMDEEISPEEQTPSTSEQYAPSLDSINEPSTSPLETVENTTSALPIIENFLNLIKTTKMIFSLQEDQQSFSIL